MSYWMGVAKCLHGTSQLSSLRGQSHFHFHWKILQSMGNFWWGTKAKTRAREGVVSVEMICNSRPAMRKDHLSVQFLVNCGCFFIMYYLIWFYSAHCVVHWCYVFVYTLPQISSNFIAFTLGTQSTMYLKILFYLIAMEYFVLDPHLPCGGIKQARK